MKVECVWECGVTVRCPTSCDRLSENRGSRERKTISLQTNTMFRSFPPTNNRNKDPSYRFYQLHASREENSFRKANPDFDVSGWKGKRWRFFLDSSFPMDVVQIRSRISWSVIRDSLEVTGSMFTDAPRSLFSFHPPSKRGWKREGDVERPRAVFRDLWIRLRSTLNANFHDDILDKKASSWGGRETKRRKEGRKGVFPRRKNINSKRESVLLDARDRGWLGRLENW